jgi:hypothetical protein
MPKCSTHFSIATMHPLLHQASTRVDDSAARTIAWRVWLLQGQLYCLLLAALSHIYDWNIAPRLAMLSMVACSLCCGVVAGCRRARVSAWCCWLLPGMLTSALK